MTNKNIPFFLIIIFLIIFLFIMTTLLKIKKDHLINKNNNFKENVLIKNKIIDTENKENKTKKEEMGKEVNKNSNIKNNNTNNNFLLNYLLLTKSINCKKTIFKCFEPIFNFKENKNSKNIEIEKNFTMNNYQFSCNPFELNYQLIILNNLWLCYKNELYIIEKNSTNFYEYNLLLKIKKNNFFNQKKMYKII